MLLICWWEYWFLNIIFFIYVLKLYQIYLVVSESKLFTFLNSFNDHKRQQSLCKISCFDTTLILFVKKVFEPRFSRIHSFQLNQDTSSRSSRIFEKVVKIRQSCTISCFNTPQVVYLVLKMCQYGKLPGVTISRLVCLTDVWLTGSGGLTVIYMG